MKNKIISLTLIAALLVTMLAAAACAPNETIYIYVPDGPPLLAVASIYRDTPDVQGRRVTVRRSTGALIGGDLVAHRPDFALVPMNLAANRWNADNHYVLAGVALWGMLHIVENIEIGDNPATSLEDLVGETIVAYQRNMTPGAVLNALFGRLNIEVNWMSATDTPSDTAVNIVEVADNATSNSALQGNVAALPNTRFALLADPVATNVIMQPRFRRAFDLQEEWYDVFDGLGVPQVGVIVRRSLIESSPTLVKEILALIESSITYARTNYQEVARVATEELMSAYLPPRQAVQSFLSGSGQQVYRFGRTNDTKEDIKAFLQVLPLPLIGGSMPTEGFWWG